MIRLYCFAACVGVFISASGLQGAPADNLKAKGLEKSGSAYVLPGELEVLKEMPALHQLKKEADEEKRTRKMYEAKVNVSRSVVTQSRKEYDTLKDRLGLTTNTAAHNRIVLHMNQLVAKSNEATATQQEFEEKVSKLGSTNSTAYVDQVMALDAKAEALIASYGELAADLAVNADLVHLNAASPGSNLKLGPTADFAATVEELKKLMSEINSEAIPLQEDHGVFTLTALLNGEAFKVCLDSGSSMILIPSDIATKLKIVPGADDPFINMKLADGSVIRGQQMTLKTVRVGRFTVENVNCAVLMSRTSDQAQPLLGNSFLSHFVTKIDQKAAQLHLTELEGEKPATIKTTPKPLVTPEK